jgi:hypothetical protein
MITELKILETDTSGEGRSSLAILMGSLLIAYLPPIMQQRKAVVFTTMETPRS